MTELYVPGPSSSQVLQAPASSPAKKERDDPPRPSSKAQKRGTSLGFSPEQITPQGTQDASEENLTYICLRSLCTLLRKFFLQEIMLQVSPSEQKKTEGETQRHAPPQKSMQGGSLSLASSREPGGHLVNILRPSVCQTRG